jgi:hypothetical protein
MALSSLTGNLSVEHQETRPDREQNMAGQLGANMGSSKDDQIQP